MMYLLGFVCALTGALVVGAVWGLIDGYRSAKRLLADHDHECTIDCVDN